MKIAVLADIHGNLIALDAVLSDIQRRGGVDGYWILGDLCAIGYDPSGVLERLSILPNAVVIRGNVDRYVITGDRPPPSLDDALKNPQLIPILAEVAGSFAWTQGHLEARGWLDWMRALPTEQRIVLPGGQQVLLIHSSPGDDEGPGLNPTLTDPALREVLGPCDADLVCVGHFHMPMERRLDGIHMLNPGSISNTFLPDLRAAYAVLDASQTDYAVTFYRVSYDRQAAIEAAQRTSNPGAAFIVRMLEGKFPASWLATWDGKTHYPPIADTL